MKSQTFLLIVIFFTIAFLFHSCAKNENQIIESEIVFHVPVLKNDGSTDVSDVIVYPNPFWSDVNVHSNLIEGELVEIQLSDENGEFSLQATLINGNYRFEVEHFPEGTYYIEIKKDGYVDRAKLLKLNWD